MSPEIIAAIVSGIGIIFAAIAWAIKYIAKNLVTFLSELKPNGGGSIKDQVTRLEKQHEKLDNKIDQLYILMIDHFKKD
jgi:hypothetical protein